MPPRVRPGWRLAVLLLALLLSSCGGVKRGSAHGKVSYKGRPVACGSVVFVGPDDTPVTAPITDDGVYSALNLPAGAVRVAVVSSDPTPPPRPPVHVIGMEKAQASQPKADPVSPGVDRKKWFPLPTQYEQVATSGITITIQPGDNTFDIELK